MLKSAQFRREREVVWKELDRLLQTMEQGHRDRLTPQELMRLPSLYRATLSSLSVARGISLDQSLLQYLENLASRAYFQIYGPRAGITQVIYSFLVWDFPNAVRRLAPHVALSAVLLLIGIYAGFSLTSQDNEWYYTFVPAEMAGDRTPTSTTAELRDVLYGDRHAADDLSVFASFLFVHNSKIGLACFALGFALGLPTLFLTLFNGVSFGAFVALYTGRGLGTELGGWLIIHGSTELLALTLCSGAGLALADAVIFPRHRSRSATLAEMGPTAGIIALGAVLMFLVAGVLEGIGRQSIEDTPTRYAIGLFMAVAWLTYFLFAGRGAQHGGD